MSLEIKLLKSEDIDDKLLKGLSSLLTNEQSISNKRLQTSAYYKWKLDNPFGSSFIVAAYENGAIIGCMTLTFKPSALEHEFLQYELGDVMVSEAHRGKMLFLKMLRLSVDELQKHNAVVVYGTPNEAALPHEKRVGFEVVENGLSYLGFPLNVASYLGGLFKVLFSPLGLFFVAASKFFQFFISIVFGLRIEKGFGDFSRLEEFRGGSINKSMQYLRWRYVDTPESYLVFHVKRRGELCSAFVLKEIKYRNFEMLYLVDWIAFGPVGHASLSILLKIFELDISKYLAIVAMASAGSKKQLFLLKLWYKFKSLKFILLTAGSGLSTGLNKELFLSFRGGDGDNV